MRSRGALCAGLALLWAAPAGAGEARLVRDLGEAASLIAIGQVAGTQQFAGGNLFVHQLDVASALKGEPPETLRILEDRRSSLRLYEKGQRVLAFLGEAPAHSFFRQHLPPGRYLWTLGGRDGVTEIGPEADGAARAIVADYLRKGGPELDERVPLRRELRSGHPRFVADAVAQLETRPELAASLGAEDLEALSACLRDPRVDEPLRARLVRLLGEGEVPGALALLRALEPSSGALLAARGEALARLGHPPGPDEVEAYLAHPSPGVRRFGIEQLALSTREDTLDRLETLAHHDRDAAVRIAAVEALGRTGRPEAARVLERTFDSEDVELRRASARAFHQLGGPAARRALSDLVFSGSRYEVQAHALVLLFAVGARKEGAAIERIRSEHPDARIRRLIDEGVVPH